MIPVSLPSQDEPSVIDHPLTSFNSSPIENPVHLPGALHNPNTTNISPSRRRFQPNAVQGNQPNHRNVSPKEKKGPKVTKVQKSPTQNQGQNTMRQNTRALDPTALKVHREEIMKGAAAAQAAHSAQQGLFFLLKIT